jgi:outer membrane murein-binding lipoprotein Lpp
METTDMKLILSGVIAASLALTGCNIQDVIAQVISYMQTACGFVANYDDVREALRPHLPGALNEGADAIRGFGDRICASVVEGGPAPPEALAVAQARLATTIGATATFEGHVINGYLVR